MEELLDNVAHDLKTPISLVGMYADGIRDGLDDGTFLDTIIRQNHRMSRLVERLLGLSRIGQQEYPEETVELDRIWEPFYVGEASRNQIFFFCQTNVTSMGYSNPCRKHLTEKEN